MRITVQAFRVAIGGMALTFAAAAFADEADYRRCAPDGIANGGYDLVSYFDQDGPQPGDPAHAETRDRLTYLFATAANLARFRAAPERYLPRYRGWCAATLAMGRLVCPDPLNYKIEDGSLLLFELAGFTNGRTVWESDPTGFRKRADENAKRLLDGP